MRDHFPFIIEINPKQELDKNNMMLLLDSMPFMYKKVQKVIFINTFWTKKDNYHLIKKKDGKSFRPIRDSKKNLKKKNFLDVQNDENS